MDFDFDLEPKKVKASKDKRCLVCKYTNPHSKSMKHTCTASIFDKKNKVLDIHLCHVHDRFLFLHGQLEFIKAFGNIYQKFLVSNDDQYTFQMFKNIKEKSQAAQRGLWFSRIDESLY